MCFGSRDTGTKTTTVQADPAVKAAATGNLDFTSKLRDTGFTPYGGNQVADFGQLQGQSFNLGGALGTDGGIYAPEAKSYIDQYGGAPASTINANPISSAMNPYMNQYVMQALAPQLEAQDQQFAAQNKNLNAAATSSGAFGDARAGIEASNLTNQQNIGRMGLIGQAYNSAFNTAIGAGAQDVANQLGASTTNASLNEQRLSRAMGAAGGLEQLGGYQGGIAGTVNQLGQQQTAQQQAKLTADYNQWLMAQQYPFQTAQLVNQSTAAASGAMPAGKTETAAAPDNSGWALAGAIAPTVGSFLLSDKREKKNIKKVGELRDGTPVKRFEYKKDPAQRPQIGLVAQDVEKRTPEAVRTIGGRKHVDMAAATAPSRRGNLESALGIAA